MTKLENRPAPGALPRWVSYILCYLIWLVLAAGAVWLMLQLRLNLLDIAMAANVNPWALGAIDKFGLLLLGLGWLVAVFIVENYLRMGVERGVLWRRIGRIAAVEAGLLLASHAVSWLMTGIA